MERLQDGFDLRRDHSFRSPPVHPPHPFPGTWRRARQSFVNRRVGFQFRRPPWSRRSPSRGDESQQRQQHQPNAPDANDNSFFFDARPNASSDTLPASSFLIDACSGVSEGLQLHGGLCCGVFIPAPDDEDFIEPFTFGGAAYGGDMGGGDGVDDINRGEESSVPGFAPGEVVFDAQQSGGVGWEKATSEDGEEDWAIAPEWAEHLRNSPSVQRYLQRVEAKKGSPWKNTRGGRGKKGGKSANATNSSSKRRMDESNGTAKDKKAQQPQILQQMGRNGGETSSATDNAEGTKNNNIIDADQNATSPAEDKAQQEIELELARMKARALLYAASQQDRQLDDAQASS